MNIAYIRVSSQGQNLEAQRETLKQYNIEKWFEEKVSGKNITDRPQLQACIEYARENDKIYILDFSRAARNTKDLLTIVETLENKGVKLISHRENIDTSSNMGKFMLQILAAVAELERNNIKEKQLLGTELAKKEGRFPGKQLRKLDEEKFAKYYAEYKSRKITKVKLAELLGLSRSALDRHLKARGLM